MFNSSIVELKKLQDRQADALRLTKAVRRAKILGFTDIEEVGGGRAGYWLPRGGL